MSTRDQIETTLQEISSLKHDDKDKRKEKLVISHETGGNQDACQRHQIAFDVVDKTRSAASGPKRANWRQKPSFRFHSVTEMDCGVCKTEFRSRKTDSDSLISNKQKNNQIRVRILFAKCLFEVLGFLRCLS